MRNAAVCLALVGLAGTADAAVSQIVFMARPWGSTGAWSSAANVVSPNLVDPIEFEVGVFYSYSTGYGFSTCVHSIYGSPFSGASGDAVAILDDNPSSTLHPDGRQGNFNFGGQFQVVYHTGTSGVDANRFRIAANGNAQDATAGGVAVRQGTPVANGTHFDSSNPAYGYHFKLSLACYNGGAERTVTIDCPITKISSYTVYSSASSATATNIKTSLIDSLPATVTVSWAPSPGPVGVLGIASLLACRRRR